jgi:hypothetical protein
MLDNNISVPRETIRLEIIEYFKKYLDIQNEDLMEGSYVTYLIDIISIEASNTLFHNEMIYRENYLNTAKLFDSVINLSQYLGYKIKDSKPAYGLVNLNFDLEKIRTIFIKDYMNSINSNTIVEIDLPDIDLDANDLTDEEKMISNNTRFLEIFGNSMPFTSINDIKLYYKIQDNVLSGYMKNRFTGEIITLNIENTSDYIFNFSIPFKQQQYKNDKFQFQYNKPGMIYNYLLENTDNISDIKIYIQNENDEFELWTEYDSMYNMNYTTKGYTLRKSENGWDILFGNGIYGYQPIKNSYCYIFYTVNKGTDGQIINNIINYSLNVDMKLKSSSDSPLIMSQLSSSCYIKNDSNFYDAKDNESKYEIKRNAKLELQSQKQLISENDYMNINNIINNNFLKIKNIIKRNDILQSDINIFIALKNNIGGLLKTYNIQAEFTFNELETLIINSLFPISDENILSDHTTYNNFDGSSKMYYLLDGLIDLELMKIIYYSSYKNINKNLISDIYLNNEYLKMISFELELDEQTKEYTIILNTNKTSENISDLTNNYEVDVIIYNDYKNSNVLIPNLNMTILEDDDTEISPVIYTGTVNSSELFFGNMHIEVILKNITNQSTEVAPFIFYNNFIAKDNFNNSIFSLINEKIDAFGNKSYYVYDIPCISYESINEYDTDEIYNILDNKTLEISEFINNIRTSNSSMINIKTMETDGVVKNMKYNKHNSEVEKLLLSYSQTDEMKRNVKYIVAFFIMNDPDNIFYNKSNQLVYINYKDELIFEEPYDGMMVYNNEDENMYVYNGRIWILPYFNNPLDIKIQVFSQDNISNELIDKIKNDIYNEYSSQINGSNNFKLYKSNLIQLVKKYKSIIDCKILKPQFDIIFDPDPEKIKNNIEYYSEQYIYLDIDNINIISNLI